MGCTFTKPLSETKIYMQMCPRVLFASLVTKKVSVKKCDLIRLYLNIRSLVPKLLSKEVFSPSRFNWLVSEMVFTAISCDMVQILDSMSAVTPFGPPAFVEPISVHALALSAYELSKSAKNISQPPLLTVVEPISMANLENYMRSDSAASNSIPSSRASVADTPARMPSVPSCQFLMLKS